MTTQLDKLLAAQEKATQKKHEAEQQEKRIRKQISDLKDRERTHRLCTRGAYLEKLLLEPDALTDEEVFELLGYAFNTPYVKDRLKTILEAKHRDPEAGKPSVLGSETRTGARENHRTFMFGAQLYARCPCALRSPRARSRSARSAGCSKAEAW